MYLNNCSVILLKPEFIRLNLYSVKCPLSDAYFTRNSSLKNISAYMSIEKIKITDCFKVEVKKKFEYIFI